MSSQLGIQPVSVERAVEISGNYSELIFDNFRLQINRDQELKKNSDRFDMGLTCRHHIKKLNWEL